MFTSNPFAALSASVPPAVMQNFVLVMVALVVLGTLFDVVHKGSATYFAKLWRSAKGKGTRKVGAGEMMSLAVQTGAVDVLTSAEFCNQQRRIAHLLTMYGFVAFAASTVVMVFCYPSAATTPAVWPLLWHIGALMVCVGGFWFWFFIRADVSAEGHSPFRVMQADLFVLSLLATTTFALIWSYTLATHHWGSSKVFLGLLLFATTVLCGSVPWSKLAHMFFKPAAAFQKRVEKATGSRRNLPAPADRPAIYGRSQNSHQNY